MTQVWRELDDKNTHVTAQIAPAVRVAIGKELGIAEGENAMGRIVAVLRRMGFDEVFDTSTGADLTVLEESKELLSRLESGENLPLFTSCCPAWINYCEKNHPELLPHISTCRSPMQMFASVIKEQCRPDGKRSVHVAIMPCTAKKGEAARKEFQKDGQPLVNYVITTQELIVMIKESGLIFREIEPEAVDMPFGTMTGAGVIFGVSGGVTEAVLRRVSTDKPPVRAFHRYGWRARQRGYQGATASYGDRELKIAIVNGLKGAEEIISRIRQESISILSR